MTSTQQRYTSTQVQKSYDGVKRLADILLAAALAVVLSPVMLALALAIRLDDPGPVLFRQRRTGRHGKLFTMLKFRTMVVNAPNISTEEMKAQGRSFHTRIGRLLRKTSLDELPQLWNILRGEMSFVGPRPALYNQDRLIALREEAGVHTVRPGITGWAQVNGRDDLDDETKVAYDREYVFTRSPRRDMETVWKTLTAIVSSRGNY